MVAVQNRADRVVLHNVSWEQYETFLEASGDRPSARMAYDNGTLEIMTPLPEHGYFKEVISSAVQDAAEELEIDYETYGSTTWRKQIKLAGAEPDNCFYFQNEAIVKSRRSTP
jgi:Uma2 family endonuclease